jgi:hypothetical protein
MNNQPLPTAPPDMSKTPENLARELKNAGFKVEICKGFVNCLYTKQKESAGMTIAALEIRFNNRLVKANETAKGFYLAFQP